jgi:N-methylhydantoinase A
MRFRRQTQSLPVPAPAPVDAAAVDELVEQFEAAYERRYGAGSGYRDAGVELVTWRVRAIVPRPRPRVVELDGAGRDARLGERPVYHLETGGFLPTAIYHGESLAPGASFEGPSVVQYAGTTVLVAPGWRATTDSHLNLWLDRAG